MALGVGDKAPELSLLHKGEEGLSSVSIGGSREKKTVILFFPLAGSGVCTDEFCSVTEDLSQYSAAGADVYGISIDNPFAQELWAKGSGIDVPLLSDFNLEATRAFGVEDDDFALAGVLQNGIANRSAFVIDESGTIIHADVSENPGIIPDFDAVKAAVSG